MSAPSSDAGSQIGTCLSSLARSDPSFLQCVIGSGAFVTRSGQVIKQLTPDQLAALTTGTITPGDFSFICPTSPDSPSSACCSAAAQAQLCPLSLMSRSDPVLKDCKNMMDQVLWQTYSCSAPASTIVAVVLGLVVVVLLTMLRLTVYRRRSRIWQRQLWALIVKNVSVWRRAAGRQIRSILFALALIGALVAVNELTGDAVSVVPVAPSLGLSMEFRGPSSLRAELLQKMRPVAGLLFLIAVTYPISQVVIAVVLEKEQRIREAIRVTGVRDAIALVAWAVSYLVAFLPLAVTLALLTHYGDVFPNTPVGALILLFIAFLAASTALCLAISAFFNQTRPAIIGTLVIVYLTHFMTFLATSSSTKQGFICLLAPACLAVAVSEALADGSQGSGFQRAYQRYIAPSPNLPTSTATAIMFVDVILYYILAWYLDQVVPQKIGARRPWHFPFHRSYWFGHAASRYSDHHPERPTDSLSLSDLSQDKKSWRKISMRGAINLGQRPQRRPSVAARIEDVDPELEELAHQNQCVDVLSLSRHYKVPGMATERVAVNQISMTLYSGQITSILGHNGAGKTTLISMLCGLVHPTSGDAIMFGRSLRRDLGRIRRSLGMCPQHDILFPDLTTKENLRLFAWLKGTPPAEVEDQSKTLVTELGLLPKMEAKVSELSGGQRRKLCVAIALIGGSKVVFLDEPTAGMDPYSRRQTWDVLLNHRKGRVMVLTTHFMDEADILSDRIAIVADGDLCCLGTSLFLKTLYGGGYRLSVSMTGSIRDSHKAIVASSGVRDLVLGRITGAQLRSSTNQGQDLMFQLPLSEAAAFPDLFRTLDGLSDRVEYGVSVTTLEDVFLAVAQRRTTVEISQYQQRAASVNMDDPRAAHHRRRRSSVEVKVPRPPTAPSSTPAQRRARSSCLGRVLYQMVIKRWWLARRDYRQPVFLIVLPLAFLLVPVIIPEIQITPILRPGPGAYPIAGSSSCSVEMATDKATSCSGSASTCMATDASGHDVQVRPQFVNVADLAAKCTLHTYMGFCKYVPWICSADVCCNWRDPRSPWYPCQTWSLIPSKITSNDEDANWNVYCPRRQYVMIQGVVNGFIKAIAILMAFVFAPALVIAHAVLEVETGTKFLQLVSGVRLGTYWLGAAIWDQIVVGIGVALAVIIMALYSYPLGSVAYFPALILVLLFALSAVPLAYSASFSFKASSRALTAILVFHIVSGAGLGILNYILQTVTITLPNTTITTTDLADRLRYVLMVLPAFSLTDGLLRLQNQLYTECVGDSRNSCLNQMPPTASDIWKNCLYLIAVAIIGWIGLIRREGHRLLRDDDVGSFRRWVIEMICSADPVPNGPAVAVPPDDEDIAAERRHIQSMIASRQLDPLVIAGMHKSYRRASAPALHPLYLSVSAGQCLGFLGINGAGKTTTIRCLTGAVRLSGGHAYIDGYDVVTDLYEARRRIGFCPQFDALFDRLTVRQHLIMYCRIRRMRLAHVAEVVDSMQLGQFADVPAGFLSGGNRRKLSAAIALLGSPRVAYLDEPSTGMDPHAKRFLWKQIANVAGSGRTAILLTTHSMEECEALCSKVAILMGGRLVGLGSIQHLKTRFGTGYTIEVRTKAVSSGMIQAGRKRLDGVTSVTKDNLGDVCERLGDGSRADTIPLQDPMGISLFLRKWIQDGLADTVIAYIGHRLPGARLKSRHGPHMLFEIRSASLADLFAIMATADGVEHYAISQTTLEEIFNGFAQLQQPR